MTNDDNTVTIEWDREDALDALEGLHSAGFETLADDVEDALREDDTSSGRSGLKDGTKIIDAWESPTPPDRKTVDGFDYYLPYPCQHEGTVVSQEMSVSPGVEQVVTGCSNCGTVLDTEYQYDEVKIEEAMDRGLY